MARVNGTNLSHTNSKGQPQSEVRLIGKSMPMVALRKSITDVVKVINTCSFITPITITGETGSGKELVARQIHECSNRADGPFIPVNCAALPEGLFQAEVFGTEKGAFTNAHRSSVGRIEAAHGGTLLLDEIGDLSLEMQVVLLRFLEEGVFEKLGSVRPVKADVCIIAATHVDLEQACKAGKFRWDLYHRLTALRVRVPPLRDRGDDVTLIADYFIENLTKQMRLRAHTLSPGAVQCALDYDWPGNVRELRNRVLQALTTTETSEIEAKSLGLAGPRCNGHGPQAADTDAEPQNLHDCRKAAEGRAIYRALAETEGDVGSAAKKLGISRAQLYRLINDHDIKHNRV
jgi:DNA-binding NtrC family response regulator